MRRADQQDVGNAGPHAHALQLAAHIVVAKLAVRTMQPYPLRRDVEPQRVGDGAVQRHFRRRLRLPDSSCEQVDLAGFHFRFTPASPRAAAWQMLLWIWQYELSGSFVSPQNSIRSGSGRSPSFQMGNRQWWLASLASGRARSSTSTWPNASTMPERANMRALISRLIRVRTSSEPNGLLENPIARRSGCRQTWPISADLLQPITWAISLAVCFSLSISAISSSWSPERVMPRPFP